MMRHHAVASSQQTAADNHVLADLLVSIRNKVQAAKMWSLFVCFDVADTNSLKEQALEGARMGYTGKQVIHPIQVPIVQDAFSPSAKKVEWATELIKAFEEHQQSGKASRVLCVWLLSAEVCTTKFMLNIFDLWSKIFSMQVWKWNLCVCPLSASLFLTSDDLVERWMKWRGLQRTWLRQRGAIKPAE